MKYINKFNQHTAYTEYEASGTMAKPNVSYCMDNNNVHYNPRTWADEYFTLESLEDNNVISLKASNTSVTCTISASTDNGKTWTEYTTSTGNGVTLGTLNTGDKLIIKGENARYSSQSIPPVKSNFFATTKRFETKGNIMSLISGDSFANADELVSGYTFGGLFSGCTGLTSAENLILPATTLKGNCYNNMFAGCTSLTAAPVLPATTLADYCYQYMFYGCTSLTVASELPATTLTSSCYIQMFKNCTSLVKAPELPATTLADSCYNQMFNGCTSLNYIKAMFTTEPSSTYTYKWVNSVSASGTFVKNSAAQWDVSGINGIPEGWTIQTA